MTSLVETVLKSLNLVSPRCSHLPVEWYSRLIHWKHVLKSTYLPYTFLSFSVAKEKPKPKKAVDLFYDDDDDDGGDIFSNKSSTPQSKKEVVEEQVKPPEKKVIVTLVLFCYVFVQIFPHSLLCSVIFRCQQELCLCLVLGLRACCRKASKNATCLPVRSLRNLKRYDRSFVTQNT